jgi:hypothetical protein
MWENCIVVTNGRSDVVVRSVHLKALALAVGFGLKPGQQKPYQSYRELPPEGARMSTYEGYANRRT